MRLPITGRMDCTSMRRALPSSTPAASPTAVGEMPSRIPPLMAIIVVSANSAAPMYSGKMLISSPKPAASSSG